MFRSQIIRGQDGQRPVTSESYTCYLLLVTVISIRVDSVAAWLPPPLFREAPPNGVSPRPRQQRVALRAARGERVCSRRKTEKDADQHEAEAEGEGDDGHGRGWPGRRRPGRQARLAP